jgi:ribosomal protein S18 acetylase RimI-like enzyme
MEQSPPTRDVASSPCGISVRCAQLGDAEALAGVTRAAETAVRGHSLASVGDILFDWADPRFSLERDTWVAVDEAGDLVAYAYCYANGPTALIDIDCAVHPDVDDLGLDEHLVRIAIRRAGEHAAVAGMDVRDVTLCVWCWREDARRRRLYERLGFTRSRVFLDMVIAAADLPASPPWPDGITVSVFDSETDGHALYAVLEEAFLDHFNPRPLPFDVWVAKTLGDQDFDPDLVLLAQDEDGPAGAVVALPLPGEGSVVQLGVLRPWRGRGLGTALLVRALHLLADRGYELLSLGVDSESPTGAADLYRRVGMRPRHENDCYERRLGEA